MALRFPELEQTEESMEGDAGHELAELFAKTEGRSKVGRPFRKDVVGTPAKNGVIFTDEMYDGAELYADDIGKIMRLLAVFGGKGCGTEERVYAPQIHEQLWGTIDQFLYKPPFLYVWDYKFGHDYVDVYENLQLLCYVAGLVNRFSIDGLLDQEITVVLRIVQPRSYHRDGPIREWRIKLSDLRAYFNTLHTNAQISFSEKAELVSGPHCKNCQARHECPAALSSGTRLFEAVTAPHALNMSLPARGFQLTLIKRAIKQLESLSVAYEEEIKAAIKNGKTVPFWMTEPTEGRDNWKVPKKDVVALGEMLNIDLSNPGVKTPKQAAKLGVDEQIIRAYSSKTKTGVRLVLDDGSKQKRIFTNG